MKPSFYILILLCFLSINLFAQGSDIQKLKDNLITDALVNQGYRPRIERYITSDYSKAGIYLATMNDDGGWADINYADRDNDWNPLNHLDRVLVMTFNYMKDTSQFFQNEELFAGIEKSIFYWYKINPVCDNWYKNQIAKQFYFNVIALLLEEKIDQNLFEKMVNDLTENPTMTGSNRTLLATSTFYRGVLEKNKVMIKLGVTGVTDQIEVSVKEGVQPDYSFHQHGHFIYNGSYGFNYLRESIWLATIVNGTQFAFSKAHIKVLRDYYLEGTRWMIRGGLIDYNVRGRQVGRADAMKLYGDLLIPILDHLAIADPEYAQDYLISKQLIEKQLPQKTFGHKHFWRSDYSIHHREKYAVSLKMCSERTVGIELNMNTENKLGYWLPYGLTYIYRTGKEYDGIFPFWNWARLPGVTNPFIEIEETQKGKAYTQQTSFVGGVSNDKHGVSVMDFLKNETSAKKSWFWFDDEFVALGADINSSHDSTIITSVNQCLRMGNVIVDGAVQIKNSQELNNPKWILHDSIGYVFPGDENIEFSGEIQSGNMQRVYGLGEDSIYSQQVFSLWFNHGVKPENGTYEYIVFPGINEIELEKYSANLPIQILSNTSDIQAVLHKTKKLTGMVFHKAGEIKINPEIIFSVDSPSLLFFDEVNKTLSVSDPSGKLDNLKITWSLKKRIKNSKTVSLPDKGFAGKSVQLKLE